MLAPHFSPEVKEMWRLKWGYSEDGKEKWTFFCCSGDAVIVFPYLLISWLYHKYILLSAPQQKELLISAGTPLVYENINSAATGPVGAEEAAWEKLQPFCISQQTYSCKSEEHFVTFLDQTVFKNTKPEFKQPFERKNRCSFHECHKNPKVVLWWSLVIKIYSSLT